LLRDRITSQAGTIWLAYRDFTTMSQYFVRGRVKKGAVLQASVMHLLAIRDGERTAAADAETSALQYDDWFEPPPGSSGSLGFTSNALHGGARIQTPVLSVIGPALAAWLMEPWPGAATQWRVPDALGGSEGGKAAIIEGPGAAIRSESEIKEEEDAIAEGAHLGIGIGGDNGEGDDDQGDGDDDDDGGGGECIAWVSGWQVY